MEWLVLIKNARLLDTVYCFSNPINQFIFKDKQKNLVNLQHCTSYLMCTGWTTLTITYLE